MSDKPNIIALPDPETDVRQVLEELVMQAEHLDCVMVVGLNKAGEQVLRTSTCSGFKKMYLVQFLNAWATKWFRLEDDGTPPPSGA